MCLVAENSVLKEGRVDLSGVAPVEGAVRVVLGAVIDALYFMQQAHKLRFPDGRRARRHLRSGGKLRDVVYDLQP